MKIITSKQNEIIKELKKQKDANRFLLFLDNPKTIEDGINANYKLKYLLIDSANQNLITKFQNCSEIYLVSKDIIKMFSDVKTPQGIIGVFEFAQKNLKLPKSNFLVLDGLQDPGNVGTLIRSALGAGFSDIYLLNCASVTNSKTIRSSMGTFFKINLFETNITEFLEFAKTNNLLLFSADMGGKNIFEINLYENLGFVLGNEGSGVSKELLDASKEIVSIPMQNNLESLNVAVSGSILMYEILRRKL